MSQEKLVSILVSAYNAERYIKEAIDSALAQTYKNVEIVVINPASTDSTGAILKAYTDLRVHYLERGYQSIKETRNDLFREARGEFITFLDSDDIYLPDKVEKEVKFLDEHPDYSAVYCDLRYFFDGEPEKLYRHRYTFYSGDIFEELLKRMFITNTTFMMRRGVMEDMGGYDESLGLVEDWDYFLRMAHKGYKFGFIDEPLVRYRLRWDSHTDFKKQAPIQQSAVMIFESLKKRMIEEERIKYNIDSYVAQRKEKLVIALLAEGKKKEAMVLLYEIKRWIPLKKRILLRFMSFFPKAVLRKSIEWAWERKKKNLFIPIEENG